MLSLMPLCLFSVCTIYVFCLIHMVGAAVAAPVGYEDDNGFHFGLDDSAGCFDW
jgi:hypothetical protein